MLEDKGISGGIFSRPIPSHIQNTITFPVPKSLQKKKRENAVYTLWHARYDLLSFIRTS